MNKNEVDHYNVRGYLKKAGPVRLAEINQTLSDLNDVSWEIRIRGSVVSDRLWPPAGLSGQRTIFSEWWQPLDDWQSARINDTRVDIDLEVPEKTDMRGFAEKHGFVCVRPHCDPEAMVWLQEVDEVFPLSVAVDHKNSPMKPGNPGLSFDQVLYLLDPETMQATRNFDGVPVIFINKPEKMNSNLALASVARFIMFTATRLCRASIDWQRLEKARQTLQPVMERGNGYFSPAVFNKSRRDIKTALEYDYNWTAELIRLFNMGNLLNPFLHPRHQRTPIGSP